ncbi:hypothetical protein A2334_02375 [Candidatus Roizmanbacteria bacterium RIFOXYB2_FULL_38_10]|uniref:TNase-like domain-containing protein n=1 Tax=Candidatus Roizmanbacteria bacterium RIFOXYD1_FULL_38_12 TaxID=1802093 RepID=A0A1F7L060_9BACT|nr:MAG: hypothetical protein A3K47_01595 [Candidatus Roizmanbacteria bacterium RIFOXYA2_FULL_38_14]OGK63478.1 MAG: hypothetical protein A3K27_01595 [Candidatus Roizmanbacteria bacterium RIFOXYA1_FULL_37_12]OGK65324.1 MAG: hypothetical protein A3K38_01595 [Candidatus Roizmanbacteria bacterium RIFOXYB1_FULL_40_23]OGK67962.1 MAG: hypothetical protein A2334_02375 [Candidatus Roizmanbacteria bacterium RIFOXYB2_FULL_38_10]OGK69729.1 MAG: hypothetical protein A3K21_01600 [Candidatus Roizmanbacteria ba
MRKRPKLFQIIYVLLITILVAFGVITYKQPPPKNEKGIVSPTQKKQQVSLKQVERVIDGDTIVIEGNQTVRYIGIDTPETKHPTKGLQCFGKEASKKNIELVEKKYVLLEKDVSEVDRYNRLLRYVWVYDTPIATGEGIFVNDYLVREGYALASTFPPDVAYAEQFMTAQQQAREFNKGLWKACQ